MIDIRLFAAPLFAFVASPSLAVTPLGGTVGAEAFVLYDFSIDFQELTTSASGLPSSLSAVASATVDKGRGTFSTNSTVSAKWISATEGNAEIFWGWESQNGNDLGILSLRSLSPGLKAWNYEFRVGAKRATFLVSWTLDVEGNSFGLFGVYGLDGLPFFVTPEGPAPTDATGSFTIALDPYGFYSFRMFVYGNVETVGDANPTASARFNMDWRIAVVPEPATWATMIAGFGLVGATVRRRNRHPAAA